MNHTKTIKSSLFNRELAKVGLLCLLSLVMCTLGTAAANAGKTFSTPQEAANALIDAAEKFDVPALEQIFGPGGNEIIHTGEPARDQEIAKQFSQESHFIIICGHYEGVDHRVIEHLVDNEISIGDYVLTNGAIAAVVLVDAIVRLLPGVLGHEQSASDDSFNGGLLEAPQYTRPADFRGWKVPDVLLSGNHAQIAKWRREQSLKRTKKNRPDLLK